MLPTNLWCLLPAEGQSFQAFELSRLGGRRPSSAAAHFPPPASTSCAWYRLRRCRCAAPGPRFRVSAAADAPLARARNTSSPAPGDHVSAAPPASAASSTTGPREVFTRIAVRFILRNSGAPIRWRVGFVRGTWRREEVGCRRARGPYRRTPARDRCSRVSGSAERVVVKNPHRESAPAARDCLRRCAPSRKCRASCGGRLAGEEVDVQRRHFPERRKWSPSTMRRAVAAEGQGEVGRRVGQDVGRVGHQDALARGRVQIDIIEADCHVRNDADAVKLRDLRGVELVRELADDSLLAARPLVSCAAVRPSSESTKSTSASRRRYSTASEKVRLVTRTAGRGINSAFTMEHRHVNHDCGY